MIIALSGRKQAGKHTIYRLIHAIGLHQNFLTRDCSWADPLKRMCIDILGVKSFQVYGDDAAKNTPVPHLLWENFPIEESRRIRNAHGLVVAMRTGPMTGREVMQHWGTNIFRVAYGQVWVEATIRKIEAVEREHSYLRLINTDTRFPNEVAAVQEIDGKVLRLTHDPFHQDHASETALDRDRFDWSRFDAVVDNANVGPEATLRMVYPLLLAWGVIEPVTDLDRIIAEVLA